MGRPCSSWVWSAPEDLMHGSLPGTPAGAIWMRRWQSRGGSKRLQNQNRRATIGADQARPLVFDGMDNVEAMRSSIAKPISGDSRSWDIP